MKLNELNKDHTINSNTLKKIKDEKTLEVDVLKKLCNTKINVNDQIEEWTNKKIGNILVSYDKVDFDEKGFIIKEYKFIPNLLMKLDWKPCFSINLEPITKSLPSSILAIKSFIYFASCCPSASI